MYKIVCVYIYICLMYIVCTLYIMEYVHRVWRLLCDTKISGWGGWGLGGGVALLRVQCRDKANLDTFYFLGAPLSFFGVC